MSDDKHDVLTHSLLAIHGFTYNGNAVDDDGAAPMDTASETVAAPPMDSANSTSSSSRTKAVLTPNTDSAPAEDPPQDVGDKRVRMRRKQKDPAAVKALAKIHEKLRDKTELYKLHLKHYHMSIEQFKRRMIFRFQKMCMICLKKLLKNVRPVKN